MYLRSQLFLVSGIVCPGRSLSAIAREMTGKRKNS
jgi:hypothetical protein